MLGHRKERTGVVLSNKMDKTVVVVVERLVRGLFCRRGLDAVQNLGGGLRGERSCHRFVRF